MPELISFVSLNIEGKKHLERVRNFILETKPDVVCFQEILEEDFEPLKKDFGMEGVFAPMARLPDDYPRDPGCVSGIAILSHLSTKNSFSECYFKDPDDLQIPNLKVFIKGQKYVLLKAVFSVGEKEFNFITTHFPWTPDGEANDNQREALVSLLNLLEKEKSFVLCGDFNAPRGKEIFSKIASVYKDNIPPEYESSLDPELHRAKGLKYMVDGLFSTPDYKIEDVRLVCGLSDHCAMTAKISKE